MKSRTRLVLAAICLTLNATLLSTFSFSQQAASKTIQVAETEFRSLAGDLISLPPKHGHTVLCFLGTECPLAKLYAPRINRIAKEFNSKGFQFVAINSNRQDSTQEWRDFASTVEIDFPIVKDHNNLIADKLGVVRNPEVLVIASDGNIPYRGRIDDQYLPGIVRSKVSREDLKIALTELHGGSEVSVSVTSPEGCLIGRIKKTTKEATVTYSRDVAPIFNKNCVECHRAGEIGPFAMTDYDEVAGWGDMIVETIDNGRMPPWHADPSVGKFANARGLTEKEKQLVRTWVQEGAQLGNPEDLPEPEKYTSGWRLPRAPDQIVSMRSKPFNIPADGTVEYQYFVVDPGFTEDKWVSAAEIIPGNRAVVHHSIVFIRPPDGQIGFGMNWLEAYVPGQIPVEYVPSRARKIPAGSKLVFQQHYTPNGKPQTDLTKIGLIYVDENQVKEELVTLAAINQDFEIQPHESSHKAQASIPQFPAEGKLLSVSPHMHYRGKSFVAIAKEDGNSKSQLLHVPNYDFNWQHNYEFSEPIPLENLKKISIEVVFDNSGENPFNPDPEQYVVWGDQTWEEMAIGFFNISMPRNPEPESKLEANDQKQAETEVDATPPVPEFSAETIRLAKEYTRSLIEKNDANGDDQLTANEMQILTREIVFSSDSNRDGVATFEEIEAKAKLGYHRLEQKRK